MPVREKMVLITYANSEYLGAVSPEPSMFAQTIHGA